ncbi:MAG: PAS domain S-box protein [Gammaproteobacteria bacterium]|nr:PAS domain S-box protein [Gammaproteobacteria bacterium]
MKKHYIKTIAVLITILVISSLIISLSEGISHKSQLHLILLVSLLIIIASACVTLKNITFTRNPDTTVTPEIENKQKSDNTRLKALIQNAVDGIITIDSQGIITFFSRSSEIIFGYSESEVIGKNIDIIMCSDHKSNHDTYLKYYRETKRPGMIKNGPREFKGRRKDGSSVDIEISINNIEGSHNNEHVGIVRDISERIFAEQTLSSSTTRFTNCIEQFPFSIQIFNTKGILTNVNGAWRSLWGIDDSAIGKYNILKDEKFKRQGLMRYIEMAFNGKSSTIPVTLFDLIDSIGSNRWIQSNIFPVYNSDGKVDEVVLISEDTTEKMRAEDERMKLNRHIRMLLESTDQGVFGINLGGVCTFINESAVKLLGYSNPDELLGERLLKIIISSNNDDIEKNPIFRTYTEGESAHIDNAEFMKKDSLAIPVEYSTRPILDDRLITGSVVVFNDITKRKRSENRLKENEEKYRQIFSAVSDAIIIFDAKTQLIIEVNSAALKLYGHSQETISGLKYHSLSNNKLTADDIIQITDNNKNSQLSEMTHVDISGRVFDVEVSFGSFSINNTAVICAAIRDITERKNYEFELKKTRDSAINAFKSKSQFLANMSHEIRTPMNGILGSLELLSDSPLTDEQTEYLNTSQECGNNLMGVLDDLLCFTKSESGKLTFESIPFNIRHLIKKIISHQTPSATKRDTEINIDIAKNLPEILIGDPTRIQQLLTNLLSNAIKFTENGRITLHISAYLTNRNNDHIHIEVKDNGIGIKPELHASIFETFMQGDASTTRNYGGTGLGLAICKQLVSGMNGNIGVISDEQAGSIFWVDFCLAHQNSSASPINNDKKTPNTLNVTNPSILLAEDNLVNQKVASAILKKLNCTVTIADDGEEALQKARNEKFDLILMDCQMPKMDGYETTNNIRQEKGPNQNTSIIALTANALYGDDIKCIAVGMNDYMSKPINKETLISKINIWVSNEPVPKTVRKVKLPNNNKTNKIQVTHDKCIK